MLATAILGAVVLATGRVPAPPLPPAVIAPLQAGIAYPVWERDGYDRPAARRALDEIRATGAAWVVLTPTCYQRDLRASVINCATAQTTTDAGLVREIAAAHRAGLRVMLKPHVDLPSDDLDRASIVPSRPDAWFAAYTRMMSRYADIARTAGVDQLAVGTELAGTSGDGERWRGVIAELRRRYDGPMTYAANYDEYTGVAFWDALDLVGVDAYWPLADEPTADAAALVEAWRPIASALEAFSRRTGKRILFTEAGYASRRGSTTAPFDWLTSPLRDDAEQAAAYEALLSTFEGRPWFAGVHWWMWDDLPGSGEDQTRDYTPRGKPAEAVLRRHWRDAATTRSRTPRTVRAGGSAAAAAGGGSPPGR